MAHLSVSMIHRFEGLIRCAFAERDYDSIRDDNARDISSCEVSICNARPFPLRNVTCTGLTRWQLTTSYQS